MVIHLFSKNKQHFERALEVLLVFVFPGIRPFEKLIDGHLPGDCNKLFIAGSPPAASAALTALTTACASASAA